MARRGKKEHLKFTLFPFVSILLAVVGVLLFLTMLQAVILKAEEPKEEVVDENQVVFERLPGLNTHTLEFSADGIVFTVGENILYKSSGQEYDRLYEHIRTNLIQVNEKYASDEISRREHLLYVVKEGGEIFYFGFVNYMRQAYNNLIGFNQEVALKELLIFPRNATDQLALNPYLPIGLVLLSKEESLVLK